MECEEFEIAENISVTQNDIQQFQLAKSAVYSAIISLIKKVGVTFGNIDKMFISGGFSAELSVSSAIKVGLIPEELRNKCESINNSSLLGTIKYASEKNNLNSFIEKAEYIELSSDKHFSDLFIKNMTF